MRWARLDSDIPANSHVLDPREGTGEGTFWAEAGAMTLMGGCALPVIPTTVFERLFVWPV